MHTDSKKDKKVHIKNERFYYGNDKYNAEATINRHVGSRITDYDAALVRQYIAEKQAVNHISESRARKIAYSLVGMRRFITVPFDQMTTEDVIAGFGRVKSGHAERFKKVNGKMEQYDGGLLSPNSIVDYIKITKQFIGWMNDAKRSKDDQINEKRLKGAARGIEGAGVTPYEPDDLLTADELRAMVTAANTIRDKAFISVLFEAHARVGEIGRLTWGDIDFSNVDFVGGTVWDSKAKKERYPTFVDSRELLISLRNNYGPGKAEGMAFVFVEDDGKPLSYIAGKKILIRAAERAIKTTPSLAKKPFWRTHNLRHSSATLSLDADMRTEDLCQLMWGKNYSPQVETYVQRSKKQLQDAQLKAKGVKKLEQIEERKAWRCPRCRNMNGKDQRFCGKCGKAVDDTAAMEKEHFDKKADNHIKKQIESQQAEIEALKKMVAELAAKK